MHRQTLIKIEGKRDKREREDRTTERQTDRKTESQKRQKDRETKRKKDRHIERHNDLMFNKTVSIILSAFKVFEFWQIRVVLQLTNLN